PGWTSSVVQQTDGTISVYLLNTKPLILSVNQTINLQLQYVKTDGTGGSRGTRVELRYQQMTYESDTTVLAGHRVSYVSIVDHAGQQNIPLHVSVLDNDTILNDGTTTNTITLRITNVSDQAITFNNSSMTAPSRLTFSFDTQAAGKNADWALTTTDSAS